MPTEEEINDYLESTIKDGIFLARYGRLQGLDKTDEFKSGLQQCNEFIEQQKEIWGENNRSAGPFQCDESSVLRGMVNTKIQEHAKATVEKLSPQEVAPAWIKSQGCLLTGIVTDFGCNFL